ncbi:MAG TPA: polyhydroxyalkanoate synthesis repressor PhaR, partial [Paracoccaceae bacterium]|nr:polyhydroxyalkanoate synthesis repressor PhaR [Paracoccaceae bacterium]
ADADEDGAPEPIVIRKYANRRLYNMAESSYVTLEDIAELVRDGADFGVFDAKSGEDITSSVLLQIIVEEEANGKQLLAPGFLSELIRLYDDPSQAIVPDYLDAAMAALRENLETFRRHQVIDDATGFEQLVRVSMEAFEQSLCQTAEEQAAGEQTVAEQAAEEGVSGEASASDVRLSGPRPEDRPASQGEIPADALADDDIRKDLAALQQQLAAMQAQIERLGRRQG